MADSGPDPAMLAKLDALEPREELVVRLALREVHDGARADRAFNDRVKMLLEQVDPRPAEMAGILAEAREVEKNLRKRSGSAA
jgi:hypothetical protein